jgi:hypothetical protein
MDLIGVHLPVMYSTWETLTVTWFDLSSAAFMLLVGQVLRVQAACAGAVLQQLLVCR